MRLPPLAVLVSASLLLAACGTAAPAPDAPAKPAAKADAKKKPQLGAKLLNDTKSKRKNAGEVTVLRTDPAWCCRPSGTCESGTVRSCGRAGFLLKSDGCSRECEAGNLPSAPAPKK